MNTAADPRPYLLLGIAGAGEGEATRGRLGGEHRTEWAPARTGWKACAWIRPSWRLRDDYWGEPAQVKRVVYTYTPDDNARAQAMVAGTADGTSLPPRP